MVDFVKVKIPKEYIVIMERNPLLDFVLNVSEKTGEIQNKKTAFYKGLKFIIYDSGYAELQGSLHKFSNNNRHNYNDFTMSCFIRIETIDRH